MLYSWADNKKKSNLMLSLFEPGIDDHFVQMKTKAHACHQFFVVFDFQSCRLTMVSVH